MRDHWVNTGEAEEMTPYIEPPWTDVDPQVAEMMMTLGYEQEDIEESLTERIFDNIMATYRLLGRKLTMCRRKINVRPSSSSDPNISCSTTQGIWASGKRGREPGAPPCSPECNVPTFSGSLEGRTINPPDCLEWRTTTSHVACKGPSAQSQAARKGGLRLPLAGLNGVPPRAQEACKEHNHFLRDRGLEYHHSSHLSAGEEDHRPAGQCPIREYQPARQRPHREHQPARQRPLGERQTPRNKAIKDAESQTRSLS